MPRSITIRNGRIGAEGRHGFDFGVVDEDGAVHIPDDLARRFPAGTLVAVRGDRRGSCCCARSTSRASAHEGAAGRAVDPARAERHEPARVRWSRSSRRVLGPMYGRASAEHLLDTGIDERAPYTTGLTLLGPGPSDGQRPARASTRRRYRRARRRRSLVHAGRAVRRPGAPGTGRAGTAVGAATRAGPVHRGAQHFAAPSYWRRGHVPARGRARPVPAAPRARR